MKHRRLLTALLACCLLAALPGCGKEPWGRSPSPTESPIGGDGTDAVTAAPQRKNPITGREDMGDAASDRPVGVMIANNDFIQGEQVGIAGADMWMEAETEAGITRLMAVFSSPTRIPSSIGPIRSARSPFVHVAEALGLAYVHAGGSAPALANIAATDIGDIDLDSGEGMNYSWRDDEYRQTHAYEFCLRTSGENMDRFIRDHGYSTTATRSIPWQFGSQTGTPATSVDIRMSSAQVISFEYDSEHGVYDKFNGAAKVRHCDITGTPIQAENILVLYTDKFWETEETLDFYLRTGTGTLFSSGFTRPFEWNRSDSGFSMTEEDGSPLTLSEGRIYLCVVSMEYDGTLSYSAPDPAQAAP